jgi:outer membrane lipoprotein-sorting protein
LFLNSQNRLNITSWIIARLWPYFLPILNKNKTILNKSKKGIALKNSAGLFIILLLAFGGLLAGKQNSFAKDAVAEGLPPVSIIEVPQRPVVATQDDATVLNEVKDYLNSIKTLKANFSQQSSDGAITKGMVHFERPGKIRFEYGGDVPFLIVSDGNILNFIDYDIGQITKWPVSDTPLALLLAEEVNFNSHTRISNRVGENGISMLAITSADPEQPQQGSLSLIFTKDKGGKLKLMAWQVIDAQGILTTVSMSNIEFNSVISRDLWAFDDPRGNRAKRNRRR